MSDDRIWQLDRSATAALVATSLGAAIAPGVIGWVHAALSIAAFCLGTGAFLWAYGIAIGRSRTDLLGVGGIYFLAGEVAPAAVARRLRLAWAVQIVVVLAAASVRPFTVVAFGILAPMLGLGLMGLWGARHGRFPPRREASERS